MAGPLGPRVGVALSVAALAALAVSGCLGADPGGERDMAEARLAVGVLPVAWNGGDDLQIVVKDAGWARIEVNASALDELSIRVLYGALGGPRPLVDAGAEVPPNGFASVSAYAGGEGEERTPVYDLTVWGMAPDMRNISWVHESIVALGNPARLPVAPHAPGIIVLHTSMSNLTIELRGQNPTGAANVIEVQALHHPQALARYMANGTPDFLVPGGPVRYEDRRTFDPDVSLSGPGKDLALTWQLVDGGARFGEMRQEHGSESASGGCSASSASTGLTYNQSNPAESRAVLGIGASWSLTTEGRERSPCGAVVMTMVGSSLRAGAGAFFLHSPLMRPGE